MTSILELREYTIELPDEIQQENSLLKTKNKALIVSLFFTIALVGVLVAIIHVVKEKDKDN